MPRLVPPCGTLSTSRQAAARCGFPSLPAGTVPAQMVALPLCLPSLWWPWGPGTVLPDISGHSCALLSHVQLLRRSRAAPWLPAPSVALLHPSVVHLHGTFTRPRGSCLPPPASHLVPQRSPSRGPSTPLSCLPLLRGNGRCCRPLWCSGHCSLVCPPSTASALCPARAVPVPAWLAHPARQSQTECQHLEQHDRQEFSAENVPVIAPHLCLPPVSLHVRGPPLSLYPRGPPPQPVCMACPSSNAFFFS